MPDVTEKNHRIEPSSDALERTEIAPGYSISRVIKGSWQLAGGHGVVSETQAIDDMKAFVEAGVTTFDCADIYTGVESLIGTFRSLNEGAFRDGTLAPIQIHTKCVPDLDALPTLRRHDIGRIVDRSLRRLKQDRLDLVQFHWWDYSIPGYVDAALWLSELQKKGKVRHIGVTNFDAARLRELLDAGVPVISNQVQYSVIDRRPEVALSALCAERGIALLCYGTLAGGFLSGRYLDAPDPQAPLENRSLTKYRLIIEEFGGWTPFQDALRCLADVARKHAVSIAMIATRYVLQKGTVAAAILGVRSTAHLSDAMALFGFTLDTEDIESINALGGEATGPMGPVYALERDRGSPHGAVMKYNLGREPGRSAEPI